MLPDSSDDAMTALHAFGVSGSIAPYGGGHINDTFQVTAPGSRRYILQRINSDVFRQPHELLDNMRRVVSHLRGKLGENRVLSFVTTLEGSVSFTDDGGGVWRLLHFVEGASSHEVAKNPGQAYQAAHAFGEFLQHLSDLPGPPLHDTIPHFHDVGRRLAAFTAAIDVDAAGRVAECRDAIAFLLENADIAERFDTLVTDGALPLRVCHNDTKLNNVLLDDATGEGLCVIDLDTTMTGCCLYDVGDLIRTIVSPTAEDEIDLVKVGVRPDMLQAILDGYRDGAGDILTSAESANLAFGGRLMTYIMALRFLTDYLQGDVYYKTSRPGQNLDRARTQIALLRELNR
jgi:Ser/Thr protein kinase RdoA (MazF antagonist)